MTAPSAGNGNINAVVSSLSGCPSGTKARWRFRTRINYGGWSGWSGYRTSTASVFARTIGAGSSMQAHFEADCYSSYTNGPNVTSDQGTGTRPYPAPSAPNGFYTSASAARFCSGDGWTAHVGWSAASYATSYSVTSTWADANGGRNSASHGSTSATEMHIGASGSTSTSVQLRVTVTAHGPGGTGGSTTGSVKQAGGCLAG